MKYSIWILPEGQAQETLKKIVIQLSKKYGGPTFEPHLTLLSPIPGKKEAIIEKANKIAKIVRPFKLTTTSVYYGETYFQCVFIRVNTSKPLIDAAMFARTLFGMDSILFPHISLFYGNVDIETRAEIAKSVKLPKLTFKAEKIVVTPAGESVSDPRDWHHLAEIPLLS